MRVLVVGASGALGRSISASLGQIGAEVVGVTRAEGSTPAWLNRHISYREFRSLSLGKLYSDMAIDAVVNCAVVYREEASSPVGKEINVDLPLRLAEVSMESNVEVVLFDTYLSKLGVVSPSHKTYVDQNREVAARIQDQASPVLYIQPEHLFGEFDGPKKFVHRLIRTNLEAHNVEIEVPNPSALRDFTYTGDIADVIARHIFSRGYQPLGGKLEGLRMHNIGTGFSMSIYDFVCQVLAVLEVDAEVVPMSIAADQLEGDSWAAMTLEEAGAIKVPSLDSSIRKVAESIRSTTAP